MSRLLRAERAADAHFAGPFDDRRQHDVHDADAANYERNRGDQAQEQDEHQPRRAGLLQQFQRHGHAEIGQRVGIFDRVADHFGRRQHGVAILHLDRDLGDFVDVALKLAWLGDHDHVALAPPERGDGDVNVVGKTFRGQRAADAGRRRPRLHHADHFVEVVVDHNLLADRVAKGKQLVRPLPPPARSSCARRPCRHRRGSGPDRPPAASLRHNRAWSRPAGLPSCACGCGIPSSARGSEWPSRWSAGWPAAAHSHLASDRSRHPALRRSMA